MRIVTRPDFDGVVCAALLHEVEPIDQPTFWIQPNAVQKDEANIRSGDILANLPYHPQCSLWFDHHYTNRIDRPFEGAFNIAPSAAGVIFEHYRGRFQRDFRELVREADKIDSADLSMDEVLYPEKYPWVLLSMTIVDRDPSDETYWNRLVDLLRRRDIGAVMKDRDVQRYCRQVIERERAYKDLLKQYTTVDGHVSITDFRPLGQGPEGNRFLVYSMFPEAAVSVRIRYADPLEKRIRLSVGHSIFNAGCRVNVGLMLADFEGGGHRAAGGCSFPSDKADAYISRIIDILLKNRPNESR